MFVLTVRNPGPLTRFPGLHHAGLNPPPRGEESKVRFDHTAATTPVHEGSALSFGSLGGFELCIDSSLEQFHGLQQQFYHL